jgi:phage/plasmid primase-like uncharacterized protein
MESMELHESRGCFRILKIHPAQHATRQVLRWMGYASGFNVQLMLISEAIPWCLSS